MPTRIGPAEISSIPAPSSIRKSSSASPAPARRHLDVEDPWSDGLVRTEHLLPGPIDKNDLDGSLRQRREVVQARDVGVDHRRVPFRQGVDLGKDLEPLAESRDRPGLVNMIVFVGGRGADATE